jgi:hypothetical protein
MQVEGEVLGVAGFLHLDGKPRNGRGCLKTKKTLGAAHFSVHQYALK